MILTFASNQSITATAPFRNKSSVLAATPCGGLSLARWMIARLVTIMFSLAFASSCFAANEQSDAQLTKLMVGAWRSPRHDYIYFADGTWWMDKKEPGVLHGRWRIRNHRLESSSTYGDEPGLDLGESSEPIHKLTQDEIIFGADYRMERIRLEDVDKPR